MMSGKWYITAYTILLICMLMGCNSNQLAKEIRGDPKFNYIRDATSDYVLAGDSLYWCPDNERYLNSSYRNPFYPGRPWPTSRYRRESRTSKPELIRRLEAKVLFSTTADYLNFREGYTTREGEVIADLIVTEEEKDLVHAIYSLYFQLTPAEVGELLNHENPNVRVYGYLFYLSRTYDIYFDYLQESFKSEEQVVYDFPEIGFYNGKCYLGTMLMSFTLKGIQVPLILDISRTCCYGPTGEQHDSLYAWFSRKKDIELDYFDWIIECSFQGIILKGIKFPCEDIPDDLCTHEDTAEFRRKKK